MQSLEGKKINLRALEPLDLELLYLWENDMETWHSTATIAPFSRHALQQYIESVTNDWYAARQLYLLIEAKTEDGVNVPVGSVLLFDFEPHHRRAEVGIMIYDSADRRKGYATEALNLVIDYAFQVLHLNQLYCNICSDNEESIALFKQCGFAMAGLRKKWLLTPQGWKDEYILQHINTKEIKM